MNKQATAQEIHEVSLFIGVLILPSEELDVRIIVPIFCRKFIFFFSLCICFHQEPVGNDHTISCTIRCLVTNSASDIV
jgi:hypothetical protein